MSDSVRSAAAFYVPARIEVSVAAVDWPRRVAMAAATALVLQTMFADRLVALDA